MADPEEDNKDWTKDPMGAHEALDRSFICTQMFSDFVADHPYVKAIPELNAEAEKLGEQLADFYQKVAKYAMDMEEEECPTQTQKTST